MVSFDDAMDELATTLDVAGISVATDAADARYSKCLHNRLGAEPALAAPSVGVRIGPDTRAPDRPADQEMEGFAAWWDNEVIWIGRGSAVVRVAPDQVAVGGPIDTLKEEDLLDDLLQFGVSAVLTSADRMVIHGAVVARDGEALVLVGPSGQGKSTLAAAALLAGWDLLGDDLAIVHPHQPSVQAVRRSPMIPAEVAADHGLEGAIVPGPRGRFQLPVSTLATGTRRLVGVVSVAHGDAGGVEPVEGADLATLDGALAVPPFRPIIRRYLATGAALIALPIMRLHHARDPEVRVKRAQASLEEALTHCRTEARRSGSIQ